MGSGACYSKQIKVQLSECDLKGRLRLSCLMRQMQQVGEDQLEQLGIGYRKTLEEHSMVFLLARIALQIERMPRGGETITLTTRPLEAVKAQFFRETVVRDAEGNLLLTAWSAWLLFDPATRRVLRPSRFPYALDCGPAPDQGVFDFQPPQGIPVGKRVVRFSDVDVNRHLTNSVYSDIAYDCLPWQVAEEGELAGVCIHFQSEARPGETIDLFTVQEGNTHYIYGTIEGRACFSTCLTFQG